MLGRPAHPVFSRRPAEDDEEAKPVERKADAPQEDQPAKRKSKAA